MNILVQPGAEEQKALMRDLLARQRARQIAEGPPSAAEREDRLSRCIALLVERSAALVEAMEADFGARSRDMSLMADIASSIGALKHSRAKVRRWMRPERRSAEFPLGLLGARAEVRFQPKGVVGVISPWNFPVNLSFGPLAGVFAAGNRAILKPSELTPETSKALKAAIAEYFDEEELGVIVGGPDVGAAFAGLPFDHLVFTGGTAIAYHVMRAAAENLTPLTLELGGKSPVILGRSADLKLAAARVMAGKTMNAGQVCLAPDYVLAPHETLNAFVEAARGAVTTMFPTVKDNSDYAAIINQRHFERITGIIEDARAKGATVVSLAPANEDFSQQEHRKIPPTLILGATADMRVMQEELFGPVMPVVSYRELSDAIVQVNAGPRPLALYYFGTDPSEQTALIERTTSGGVAINDVIAHIAQEDLPFGGIGPSGMGAYHGRDGFLEFSHKKAVYRQTMSEAIAMIRPPYGEQFRKFIGGRVKV